jgi:hypothetical protein
VKGIFFVRFSALVRYIKFLPFSPTMKFIVLSLTLLASVASAQDYLEISASPGLPGSGKKVVLVAGDEEYRTEESMPMLAKILAKKHGFNCIVLFSTD